MTEAEILLGFIDKYNWAITPVIGGGFEIEVSVLSGGYDFDINVIGAGKTIFSALKDAAHRCKLEYAPVDISLVLKDLEDSKARCLWLANAGNHTDRTVQLSAGRASAYSHCLTKLKNFPPIEQLSEWTVQDGDIYYGIEVNYHLSKDGRWAYSYSNYETWVCGFLTRESAADHASSYCHETASDRSVD